MTRKIAGPHRGASFTFAARTDRPDFGPRTMRGAAPAKTALPGRLHRALRAATRSDHVAVDGLVLRLDLRSREDYGRFLRAQQAAVQSLEADWREEDRKDFSALLRCAREDLKSLKTSVIALHSSSRAPLLASQRLGVAYVIRSSRLGASLLRHRVPALLPSSYLDFEPTLSWPQFLLHLDPLAEDADRASSYEVIRGARLGFELFASLLTQALA